MVVDWSTSLIIWKPLMLFSLSLSLFLKKEMRRMGLHIGIALKFVKKWEKHDAKGY